MNDVTRTSKEMITAPENPSVEDLIAFYGDSTFRSGVTVRVPYRATRQALEDLQERVNDLLAQLAEKVIGDSSDTPQFFRNREGDIDFGPVATPEPRNVRCPACNTEFSHAAE